MSNGFSILRWIVAAALGSPSAYRVTVPFAQLAIEMLPCRSETAPWGQLTPPCVKPPVVTKPRATRVHIRERVERSRRGLMSILRRAQDPAQATSPNVDEVTGHRRGILQTGGPPRDAITADELAEGKRGGHRREKNRQKRVTDLASTIGAPRPLLTEDAANRVIERPGTGVRVALTRPPPLPSLDPPQFAADGGHAPVAVESGRRKNAAFRWASLLHFTQKISPSSSFLATQPYGTESNRIEKPINSRCSQSDRQQ